MTDRPIIFSAPMIRALLDGRKIQTRRLAWATPRLDADKLYEDAGYPRKPTVWQKVEPGDRLWVREGIFWLDQRLVSTYDFAINYVAKESRQHVDAPEGWQPPARQAISPIHMPRWASRLTLVVTDARLQRVQDIDLQDARAEGCQFRSFSLFGADCERRNEIGRIHFRQIWESLHGADSWNANPEVVALTFAVHKTNIDRMEAEAA